VRSAGESAHIISGLGQHLFSRLSPDAWDVIEGLDRFRKRAHLTASNQYLSSKSLEETSLLYHHTTVEEGYRAPMVTSVEVPDGVEDANVRKRLLARYNLEMGGDLGSLKGHIWRVGLMGHSCTRENVFLFLSTLEDVLLAEATGCRPGRAGVQRDTRTVKRRSPWSG